MATSSKFQFFFVIVLQSIFTLEGDKLIQVEKAIKPEDKDSRFERYVDENGQLIIVGFY